MTNVLLMAAVMVTNHIGTATNGLDVVTTTNSCRLGGTQTVEMYLRQAENFRQGPRVGASVDMTILAVRELHKEVEALREEVKRLREEQQKPAPVQPQPQQWNPWIVPMPQPWNTSNIITFPTGLFFNVRGMVVTNYVVTTNDFLSHGGLTP